MASITKAAREVAANTPKSKGEILFLAAFTLFYLEDFNIFRNPHVFTFSLEIESSVGVNMVSILVTLAGFAVLSLMYQRHLFAISEGLGLRVCCGLIMAGSMSWAMAELFPNPLPLRYVGLLFVAFGHLCFLPQMVRHMAIIGVKKTMLLYSVLLVITAFAQPVIGSLPPVPLYAYLLVSPVIMLACLENVPETDISRATLRKDTNSRIPKTLLVTLVAVGLLTGAKRAAFSASDISVPVLNVTVVIVAALLVICASLTSKLNFNRLIYLISIPAMCAGLIFLILPNPEAIVFGHLAFNLGYCFFYGALWALYSYLVRFSSFNYYWLPVSAAIGTFVGRIAGIVLFAGIRADFPAESMMLPFGIAGVVLLAMAISTGFCARNNMRDGWGSVTPSNSSLALDPFERSCEIAANNAGLTPREVDVMKLLAKGRNTQHIAETLFISRDTTKTHVKRIYRKMGVHSQQEVIDTIDNISKQTHSRS